MTNKPGFLTDMLLPFFPELLRAQTVVCGDTLAVAKPHPEPLLHASQQMGVDHRDCIYIGDIEKDMIAAKAANMVGYVAGWGYIGDEHTPSDWHAQGVLSHPSDILTVVALCDRKTTNDVPLTNQEITKKYEVCQHVHRL